MNSQPWGVSGDGGVKWGSEGWHVASSSSCLLGCCRGEGGFPGTVLQRGYLTNTNPFYLVSLSLGAYQGCTVELLETGRHVCSGSLERSFWLPIPCQFNFSSAVHRAEMLHLTKDCDIWRRLSTVPESCEDLCNLGDTSGPWGSLGPSASPIAPRSHRAQAET